MDALDRIERQYGCMAEYSRQMEEMENHEDGQEEPEDY